MQFCEGKLTEERDDLTTVYKAYGQLSGEKTIVDYRMTWKNTIEMSKEVADLSIVIKDEDNSVFHVGHWFDPNQGLLIVCMLGANDTNIEVEDLCGHTSHLSFEEAKNHPDAAFVMKAAQLILSTDSRKEWLQAWLTQQTAYADPAVADGEKPVLYLYRNERNKLFFSSSELNSFPDCNEHNEYTLFSLIDADHSIKDALQLKPREVAWRKDANSPWQVERHFLKV